MANLSERGPPAPNSEAPEDPAYWEPTVAFLRFTIAFVLAGSLLLSAALLLFAQHQQVRAGIALAFGLVAVASALIFVQGRVKAAFLFLGAGIWGLTTLATFALGGAQAAIAQMYPLMILLAGWLLSTRAAIVVAVLSSVAVLGVALLEQSGLLVASPPMIPAVRWIIPAMVFALTAVLIHYFVRAYRSRLQELRESEARFHSLSRLSSDWFWEQDSELRFVSTSGGEHGFGGITALDHVGRRRWELPGTEIVGQGWEEHRAALEARQSFRDVILRRRSADGVIHYVSVAGEPVFDAAGAFIGYRGVATDVTQRIEAEQQARDADERLRLAIEYLGESIAITDADDRIVMANRVFRELNGNTHLVEPGHLYEDHLRAGIALGNFPEAIGREEAWLAARLERRRIGGQIDVKRQEGTWLKVTDQRLPDGGMVHFALDVTDIKKAEELLRQALENLGEMICLTDAEDRIVLANRRMLEFNAQVAEYLAPGRGYDEHLRAGIRLGLFPDAEGREDAWVAERMSYRRAPRGPVERRRQDGRWLLVDDQVLPDGSIISWGVEITDAKRAEEALRALNVDLERRVAERTAQLEASNRELESFSYSVSHDLRAPLRAVTGFSKLLLEQEGPKLSSEARRYLGVIDANGRRMGSLIDALLALGRYTRVELNKVAVDMGRLAQEVADELAPSWPGSKIEVGPLPPALGNATLLKQVLLNLVGNALKYSANVPAPRVEVRAAGGRYVVSDNGVGFDMAYVDKLFKPFERLHTEREFEGTGIGLAIVKLIVERHGGSIEARSTEGGGASFSFMLGRD